MDEGRKRVLGILTAILVAPRLKDWAWDGRGGASTCEGFVRSAMGVAVRIMTMIDQEHSVRSAGGKLSNEGGVESSSHV